MDRIAPSVEFLESMRGLDDVRHASPEIRQRFSEFLQRQRDLFCIKDDPVFTVGTDDVIVTLEPTDRLREFLAAVRAWKDERNVA